MVGSSTVTASSFMMPMPGKVAVNRWGLKRTLKQMGLSPSPGTPTQALVPTWPLPPHD